MFLDNRVKKTKQNRLFLKDRFSASEPPAGTRLAIVAQDGCYHGDTLGAMNVAVPSVFNRGQHAWCVFCVWVCVSRLIISAACRGHDTIDFAPLQSRGGAYRVFVGPGSVYYNMGRYFRVRLSAILYFYPDLWIFFHQPFSVVFVAATTAAAAAVAIVIFRGRLLTYVLNPVQYSTVQYSTNRWSLFPSFFWLFR